MLAVLIALQLPRDDCCLMRYRALEDLKNVSEVQVDEKIIPAIADLDIPLVLGCRWRTREDLENLSEAQVRQDHPSHHRLGHSIGYAQLTVEADQSDTRSSEGLMDRKRREQRRMEMFPYHQEDLRRLESLLFNRSTAPLSR